MGPEGREGWRRGLLGTLVQRLGHPWAPWLLGIGLSLVAAVRVHHETATGSGAFLRWDHDVDSLWAGDAVYLVGGEGYPTLPLTLLVLSPFHALGPMAGGLLWGAFKIGLAWWIVCTAFRLANSPASTLTDLGKVAVLLLSFRPLLSDLAHANLNILVGATIAAGAWAWHQRHELRAGAWLGVGVVLKVTPALALLFFLWKRSGRGAAGMALGALLGLLLPALFLGWDRNLALDLAWFEQMIVPYLHGRELTVLQTDHLNQSLLGVLARLLTESVAMKPSSRHGEVSIYLATLGPAAFRVVHLLACGAVLVFLFACFRGARGARDGPTVLAEFSMLALAMLFLSERSWKHHYVLLVFPVAFLCLQLYRPREDARFRIAAAGLLVSLLVVAGTGSAVLGAYASDLAEAYGSFFIGGLGLFVATGLVLRRERGRAHTAPG